MTNKKEKEKARMTLKGYYEGLPKARHPKTDFITQIMKECSVSTTTARNWVLGFTKPFDSHHIEKLSEMTGIPKEELWG